MHYRSTVRASPLAVYIRGTGRRTERGLPRRMLSSGGGFRGTGGVGAVRASEDIDITIALRVFMVIRHWPISVIYIL
jgi:hypothetical protein